MSSPSPSLVAGRTSAWKWWVCGLLLLATMINYMDRVTLNQLAKRINTEFGLSEREYGWLEGAFGNAFALGAIVTGWLVDRWNVRWMYAAAVLAWSAAGFATGLVYTFAGLVACRFMLGLAEAGNWPCALKTTQRILPPSERTMGNSILQSGAALGAIVTPLIILAFLQWTDNWRYPFLVIGAVGAGWVFLWLGSVRAVDLEPEHKPPSPSLMNILGFLVVLLGIDIYVHVWWNHIVWLPLASKSVLTVLGIAAVGWWLYRVTAGDSPADRAIFLRRFAICAFLVAAINIPWHFLRAWLPLFLQNVHDFSDTQLSWFLTGYYLSTDIGSLTVGFLTLALVRRGMGVHSSRVTLFALGAFVTLLCLLVPQLAAGPLLVATLLVIGFAVLGLFPVYYSLTQELSSQHQGKVSGALGCINWLVMALMQEAVGDTVKRTGSYSQVIPAVGFIPLIGLVLLILFWGAKPVVPSVPLGDKEPAPAG